jgi:hypothetical protein
MRKQVASMNSIVNDLQNQITQLEQQNKILIKRNGFTREILS